LGRKKTLRNFTIRGPMLTDEQAYDVAGYIVSQDRPKKANLDEDFPIRLQRPVDTPYGPYAVAVADKKFCIS